MLNFDDKKNLSSELKKLLYKIDLTELLVIKCHLLIEFAMNQFIKNQTNQGKEIEKEGFTFSQKLKICKMLGLFKDEDDLKIFIQKLNKLRNQISHTLTYDSNLLEELCLYDLKTHEKRNTYLRNQLKGLSLITAGRIIGQSKRTFNCLRTSWEVTQSLHHRLQRNILLTF